MKKIAFTDENREQIIAEQEALGFRLYEEQRHTDGWWLLFTNEPYVEHEPPRSTHFARIDSFHPGELKPLRVTRTWEGNNYTYDCFVTETLKDQYLTGDVVIGDYVLVHFDDSDKKVAMLKIFKTW